MKQFTLSTILHDGRPVPAIEVDGHYYNLQAIAPHLLNNDYATGLMALFNDWAAAEVELRNLAPKLSPSTHPTIPIADSESFLTPLQYPRKLILGGANYYEHMHKDAGKPDFKKESSMPVFFLKPPTTTLVGCGRTVTYPAQSKKFDWEIELAVVIGSRLHNASEEEAVAGVAAYTIGLDLSARDWQMNERHPWQFDLFTGKAFDTSCPVGPKLVPASFLNPSDLRLKLAVNGVVKQDARTSDMIWNIGEQISQVSQHVTLEPGDILLTGTPAGVGLATGEYLSISDVMTAEIDGLGTLQVEVKK